MGGADQGGSELTAGAEAAFASYLARIQRGEEVDFDAFCQERPAVADSLRLLHSTWISQRRPPEVQTIREFLTEREADPGISLDPDASGEQGRSGVHERLTDLASRTGRYSLRGEVARGGMGIILRVWDQDLRRTLAMKTTFGTVKDMKAAAEGSADISHLSRFLEEAQITGQLDHPGIVPVHELGVDSEGRLFFTMRLVRGMTLDEVIRLARADDQGWSRARALDVMVRVCEAMAYAHSKGVIHRDIKPANIMVGKFGEVYVMDWGLAKVIGRADTHAQELHPDVTLMRTQVLTDRHEDLSKTPHSPLITMQGTIIGTPAYMPPEQAEGRIGDLDPRSDVYSIGALLYTLLTGWMPYVDPAKPVSGGEVLNRLLTAPPKPVFQIEPTVPAELIAICEKAMSRHPEGRYASMIQMAEDLRAYVEGRVVRAHKTGAVAEFKKWVVRNKGTAAAVAALLVLLLGGSIYVAWQERENLQTVQAAHKLTVEARGRAETNAIRAQDSAERAERQSYFANLAAAHASLRVHEAHEAKQLLAACPEHSRGWEWRFLDLSADTSRARLDGHTGKVTAVAFSPDGSRIASGSDDKTVRLWDAATGEALFSLPGSGDEVTALAFSPDGARLAAASKDMLVRVWDAQAGRLLGTLTGHESAVSSLAFAAAGDRIVTGDDAGAHTWDAVTLRRLQPLAHDQPVHAVAFSPDGTRVATGTDDGVHLWDAKSGEPVRTIELEDGATCLTYGKSRIAAGSLDASIHIVDPETGAHLATFTGHADPVTSVRFTVSGTRLVSASYDKTVRVWDIETATTLTILHGHDQAVLAADCERSETSIVSASADRTVRLWRMQGGDAALALGAGEDFISAVAFAPGGGRLAAASAGSGEIRFWDAGTGRALASLTHEGGGISSIAFDPQGRRLVVGGEEDANARILDAVTGQVIRELKGHEASVTAVAFSPDGTVVATGSADNTARLWSAQSGKELHKLEGHDQRVSAVAFGPHGNGLVSTSFDGTARLWGVSSGAAGRVFRHGGPVLAATFDPEGTWVVTAGTDTKIRFFEVATGEIERVLAGHAGAVSALAFNGDGSRLVSGGRDKTVRIWDANTGDSLLRLAGHDGWITSVAFNADSDRIASGSFDATARLWRTNVPKE